MVVGFIYFIWNLVAWYSGVYDNFFNEAVLVWWYEEGVVNYEPQPISRAVLTGFTIILQVVRFYYCNF